MFRVVFLDRLLLILIMLKVYFETSLYNIFLSYYQVANKINVITLTNIISGTLVISISLLAYFYNQSIYVYLFGINVAYLLIFFVHYYKIGFRFSSLQDMVKYLRKIYPQLKYYGITTVTVPIYMMLPTVIGSFVLSPSALAKYQIAFSISNILLLISVSLLQVKYADFITCKNNFEKLAENLKKTGYRIISVNLLIVLVFFMFGKDILLIIYQKEEYLEAYFPLLLLLVSNIIFMFAAIAAVVMVVFKLQKEKAKYHIEFIVVSLVFGVLLSFSLGIYGLVCTYIIIYTYSAIRYFLKYKLIYKSFIDKD